MNGQVSVTSTSQSPTDRRFALLGQVAWRGAVLAFVAMLGALGANRFRREPLELKAYSPPTQCSEASETPTASVLSAQAVSGLCGRDDVLFADARDEDQFAMGHVTGATHLPCTSSRGNVGQLFGQLQGKRTLVVYGNSTDEARQVADGLLRQTKRRDLAIIVLQGGFSAWRDSGLACSSGACESCNETTSSTRP
jgi:rhodanese-related sulfurtransferase